MNKLKSAVAVAAVTVAAACLAVPAMAGTAPRYERALSVAAPSVTTDSATVTWLVPPQDAGASFEVLAYHADDPLLATSSPQVVYAWVICVDAPADNPAT